MISIYLKVPTNKDGKSLISIKMIDNWSTLIKRRIDDYCNIQQIKYSSTIISTSLEIDDPLHNYNSHMYNNDGLKIINLYISMKKDSDILDSFTIKPAEISNYCKILESQIDNRWKYILLASPFEIEVAGNNKVLNIPCKMYDDEEIEEIVKEWDN